MAHDRRKRLLIGTAGFVGLLIAALLIVPLLIDVDAYKPEIAAQVKRATGRDVAIEGPVRLSLLPTPSVELDGVKLFNPAGSKNPNLVEVKSVSVTPSLLALLAGDIEVAEVALVEPKIVLEINAEGKPNWELAPSVAEAKPLSLARTHLDARARGRGQVHGRPARSRPLAGGDRDSRAADAPPRRGSSAWSGRSCARRWRGWRSMSRRYRQAS